MREQQSGLGNRQYVRKLPHLTQEQIIAQARQQARHEAADESYSGHYAGFHPEHQPFHSQDLTLSSVGKRIAANREPANFDAEGDFELEEDPRYYDTRPHTSARRYDISPEQIIQRGNKRYHVQYVDVPKRKSRQAQLPPPPTRQRPVYTDEIEVPIQQVRSGKRLHPVAWLGLFGMFLILGWIGLNYATAWYQGVQDDWTYGTQRHFEINYVVGHSDSAAHPSHFTAENNNGEIIVIELPGGDVSKAKIYQIETVPNNTGNPPVKLSFTDMNGDGKPNMIVQIGDGSAMLYVTLLNNGSQFVSKL